MGSFVPICEEPHLKCSQFNFQHDIVLLCFFFFFSFLAFYLEKYKIKHHHGPDSNS